MRWLDEDIAFFCQHLPHLIAEQCSLERELVRMIADIMEKLKYRLTDDENTYWLGDEETASLLQQFRENVTG